MKPSHEVLDRKMISNVLGPVVGAGDVNNVTSGSMWSAFTGFNKELV